MFAGPSLVVDQFAPPSSLVKTPTEVAAYNQRALAGWRFTSNTGACGRLPVIELQVAPPSSVCQRLLAANPVKATMARFGLSRASTMRSTTRAGKNPCPTRVHVGAGLRPSSARYTSPLLCPTQIIAPLPSATAMALMKLSVAAVGALIVLHATFAARASSVTQSDAPPAMRRRGSLGSRTRGAMKFSFFVAADPR